MKNILIWLIQFYQIVISPLFPATCRFTPSCSEYTKQAIKKYGVFQGSLMGWRRIRKCHPRGGSGHDPVP
jgi:putative membrane protein insertion efficiency factor